MLVANNSDSFVLLASVERKFAAAEFVKCMCTPGYKVLQQCSQERCVNGKGPLFSPLQVNELKKLL